MGVASIRSASLVRRMLSIGKNFLLFLLYLCCPRVWFANMISISSGLLLEEMKVSRTSLPHYCSPLPRTIAIPSFVFLFVFLPFLLAMIKSQRNEESRSSSCSVGEVSRGSFGHSSHFFLSTLVHLGMSFR